MRIGSRLWSEFPAWTTGFSKVLVQSHRNIFRDLPQVLVQPCHVGRIFTQLKRFKLTNQNDRRLFHATVPPRSLKSHFDYREIMHNGRKHRARGEQITVSTKGTQLIYTSEATTPVQRGNQEYRSDHFSRSDMQTAPLLVSSGNKFGASSPNSCWHVTSGTIECKVHN